MSRWYSPLSIRQAFWLSLGKTNQRILQGIWSLPYWQSLHTWAQPKRHKAHTRTNQMHTLESFHGFSAVQTVHHMLEQWKSRSCRWLHGDQMSSEGENRGRNPEVHFADHGLYKAVRLMKGPHMHSNTLLHVCCQWLSHWVMQWPVSDPDTRSPCDLWEQTPYHGWCAKSFF